MNPPWLHIEPGDAPLIVSIPHAGTLIPPPHELGLVSVERARKDADWHVDRLYAFARAELGATIVRTDICRTVVDVNRDPTGASLYPGQATTGLCPTVTFDDEPLYEAGCEPDPDSIEARRTAYFDPYHAALAGEIDRLRSQHPRVVLYEAHSIRSRAPLLFEGELPELNIGTNGGLSCDPRLREAIGTICAGSGRSWIADGRFRGGWITRHYGEPHNEIHAIQMESAMRFYLDEAGAQPWPPAWNEADAEPARALLREILTACLDFAEERA